MKKIKNLSLVAMLFAAVVAFAFTPAKKAAIKYAYQSTSGSNYVVSESLDGETLGTHWLCNLQENAICTFDSETAPDGSNQIPVAEAFNIVTGRVFVDLYTPGQGDTD